MAETPEIISSRGSNYNQSSFIGGMNLLGDDSRLQPNQYRIGFNLTNRFDELDPILQGVQDVRVPPGVVQEFVTFGNYLIIFVNGRAYYRFYTDINWTFIQGFQMSPTAPRYWTVPIPVSTTNYIRIASTGITNPATTNPAGAVQLSSVQGASAGNLPGLLVQDNINQPLFIFLDANNIPIARTTQTFVQWQVGYTDATNSIIGSPAINIIPNGASYGATTFLYVPVVLPNTQYTILAGPNEASYSIDNGATQIVMINGQSYTFTTTSYGLILTGVAQILITAVVTLATAGADSSFDKREYVPIGNVMTWDNGVLYIVSQDFNFIYRSVSGRPLDFVVNVFNTLATNSGEITYTYVDPVSGTVYNPVYQAYTQYGGGDATTTSYTVGAGGITCVRAMSTGGIFVSASGANFNVTQNTTPNAPTLFGEYTFIRTFLFNAVCLSDRAIFDSLGDTRFIDLTGVRSFNAIESLQNEGRNSVFTHTIQAAFEGVTQDATLSAAILYDNYELYAMNTIFGPVIGKYDTINNCWTSFDISQTGGKLVKILAKIELSVQALYAITEDNELWSLYSGTEDAIATVRTIGVCANILYANTNIKMNDPKNEVRLDKIRVIVNKITEDCKVSMTPYINNRLSSIGTQTKNVTYSVPVKSSSNPTDLPDVNTMLTNMLFSTLGAEQGWKTFALLSWTDGVITQYSFELANLTPINPLNSQAVVDIQS